ncbi:MAG: FCD domain-containing protein [Rhodospirillales bacterium]|nr:FCD domain-containing protein [Rhodospirillales bacterium]MDE2573883.1 FCD domain-containing protein [Rhodospirillales bacterium]
MIPPATAAESTQADRAFETLRGDLLAGLFPPGSRLRPNLLQANYGIGLTPLREALTRLEAAGLVVSNAQRGFRVAEASRDELADLTRTRCDIERLCLVRAITRGDTDWEAEIVAAYHALSRTPLPADTADRAALDLWETRHRRFHRALIAACGSAWLLRFWDTLADHSERYRKLRLAHRHRPEAEVRDLNGEHEAIMQAALRRDAAAAIALAEQHLAATERAVWAVLHEAAAAR